MKIEIKKFGTLLVSRPAGREAYGVIQSYFDIPGGDEPIELDFAGVDVMAPSWLDEVLTPLVAKYGNRVICLPCKNLSVIETLKLLKSMT